MRESWQVVHLRYSDVRIQEICEVSLTTETQKQQQKREGKMENDLIRVNIFI